MADAVIELNKRRFRSVQPSVAHARRNYEAAKLGLMKAAQHLALAETVQDHRAAARWNEDELRRAVALRAEGYLIPFGEEYHLFFRQKR